MFDDGPQDDPQDLIERQSARIDALLEILSNLGFDSDELADLLVS